ncbi:recombinase family protein [Methylobacterium sp.]|uniref:recombinase family protein n=1 Tax=Methylobacterium sp. TaxID=409 RepID=UPI003AFFB30D
MIEGKVVTYLRVSTDKQGRSGLGLEAQRKAVTDFLNGGRRTMLAEFVEVESGSRNDRPKLAEALALCRIHKATLVIAKLDRLSRDVHFLTGLERAGIRFVAADMPEANEMVVHIMAVMAQAERKLISARTKAALAAAKARGTKLGGDRGHIRSVSALAAAKSVAVRQEKAGERARDLGPIIATIRAEGAVSLRDIAAGLNGRGITTARGAPWSAIAVSRVLALLGEAGGAVGAS